jgi:hypothetical protein
MTVDLNYDELVLLIQLVNRCFVEKQRKDPNTETPFEANLFKKLYAARTVEMQAIKGQVEK